MLINRDLSHRSLNAERRGRHSLPRFPGSHARSWSFQDHPPTRWSGEIAYRGSVEKPLGGYLPGFLLSHHFPGSRQCSPRKPWEAELLPNGAHFARSAEKHVTGNGGGGGFDGTSRSPLLSRRANCRHDPVYIISIYNCNNCRGLWVTSSFFCERWEVSASRWREIAENHFRHADLSLPRRGTSKRSDLRIRKRRKVIAWGRNFATGDF